MPIASRAVQYICPYCRRIPQDVKTVRPLTSTRRFTHSPQIRNNGGQAPGKELQQDGKEPGAMSRRLEQMSDESLETGGSGARKAVHEAGFDEDLKRRLEERIAAANFKNDYASALAQAELPTSAGRGTRDIAGAAPWTGNESLEDAALRMLNDAHKPLRVPARLPPIRTIPTRVDTGRAKNKPSSGTRLANARDKTSVYSSMKDVGMTAEEREKYRKEVKERFTPGARSVPATLTGLASLANERIEDAIARGQFKNLPRGKKIERDYNASSPFLDTTEYLMNKMIQRQDIVPPWIERQQDLVSIATKFRARLRYDWKRHAARMIASQGGTLEDQVRRAKAYAAAEAIENPQKRKEESFNTVDAGGHLSQITLAGELRPTPDPRSSATTIGIEVRETTLSPSASPQSASVANITISQDNLSTESNEIGEAEAPTAAKFPVYRDPFWESNERSFQTLAIADLNSKTRSYNLIAPAIAQKPYFNLDRELKSCFADVAPLLPAEIRERASRPKVKIEVMAHNRTPGVLETAFVRHKTRVYDEDLKVKGYGFRQFWSELWNKDGV
jgi:hypothetical protein